jgi:hypothetical protein
MAETNQFSRLDHRLPVARAEVARVGSGWADVGQRVERSDAVTHFSLDVPVQTRPQEETPPAPPPSESELRGTLAQAITAKAFADEQAERATSTVARAGEHVERCRARVESFSNLDDETAAALVEALRGGDWLDQGDGPLRQRRAEAQIAADDLRAAERAAAVLTEARDSAQADADAASRAARVAAIAVAGLTAEQLAQHVLALEDLAAREREALYSFDRISVGAGVRLPPAAFDVVVTNPQPSRPLDTSAWQRAIDRLLTDASAVVSAPLPEHVARPPSRRNFEIRRAVPIRPLEPAAEGPVADILEPASEG